MGILYVEPQAPMWMNVIFSPKTNKKEGLLASG